MAAGFDYIPTSQALSLAFMSGLAVAAFCVLSQLGVNTETVSFSFLMLPTLALYLWPRGAHSILSLLIIFAVGMLQDRLSFGPTGLWSLTWLVFFIIYRPDMRAKPVSFLGSWAGAILALCAVALFQFLLVKFILNRPVALNALGLAVLTGVLLYPPFYLIREYLARSFGNRDSFYYETPSR